MPEKELMDNTSDFNRALQEHIKKDNAAIFMQFASAIDVNGKNIYPAFKEIRFVDNKLLYQIKVIDLKTFRLEAIKDIAYSITYLDTLSTMEIIEVNLNASIYYINPPVTDSTVHLNPIAITGNITPNEKSFTVFSKEELKYLLAQKSRYLGTDIALINTMITFCKILIKYSQNLIESNNGLDKELIAMFSYAAETNENDFNRDFLAKATNDLLLFYNQYQKNLLDASAGGRGAGGKSDGTAYVLKPTGHVAATVIVTVCVYLGITIAILLIISKF